jgi:murein DD-endopeptidase MepM/ murein hydrolase activator NlpD
MAKFSTQPVHPDYMKLRTALLASINSAKFGMVRNGGTRAHQGIDIKLENGYRCYAVEDATVVNVNTVNNNGYGLTVTLKLDKLNDGKQLYVFYAHLSDIRVKVGDKVEAGHVIGLSGCTGNAKGMNTIEKGSHLHFEVRTVASAGVGLAGRLNPLDYVTLVD